MPNGVNKISRKSKRTILAALSMLVFGISGTLVNIALQRPTGILLFASMAFLGALVLVSTNK